jgi:hypothetical protein
MAWPSGYGLFQGIITTICLGGSSWERSWRFPRCLYDALQQPPFIHDGLTYVRHSYHQNAIIPSPESLDSLFAILVPKSSHVTTAKIPTFSSFTTDHEKRHGLKQT